MLDVVIDITNTIAITTIINIRSPPSSISKRSRLWHCKNGHLRWTRTMDSELWPPDEQGPHCFPSPRPHHRPTGCTDEPIATRDQQIQNSQPGDLKICLFTSSILPLPHLVSSSGSCGGGVFGFKSRRGFFFSFRIDWSTVPEASAANIIEDLGNFAFEFLTLETRTIDCSYEMICKRITSVSVLDLYDSP